MTALKSSSITLKVKALEAQYIIDASKGLLSVWPEKALTTHTDFTASQIKLFSKKIENVTLTQQTSISINEPELLYLSRMGVGLLLGLSEKGELIKYTNYTKEEILIFSKKIKKLMDKHSIHH